jgi:hypothetical protein
MSPFSGRQRGHRRAALPIALALVAASVLAPPVAAGRPTITREIDIHFHLEQHFDGDPSCGPFFVDGVTEIADGSSHLVIIDDGSSLKVTFGETFKILAVPDDPSIATNTRHGTDAGHFIAQRDGDVIFHESFHDYGPAAWDLDAQIRFVTTFTTKNGEVHVDHLIENDMPPPGC